jgi:hypothetical protein
MIQRGRKSSSSNIVTLSPAATRLRLTAPATLTANERAIFIETAAQHPHLKPGDAMVLAAFAQASARSFKLAKKEDTAAWEKSVRAMLALARSLRLTPISGTRAETLGRKRDQQTTSYYDRMRHDDADQD